MNFKDFFEQTEIEKNVKQLLKKLPTGHRKLLNGYKFKYEGGNTLKGDNGNIGVIYKDKITVSAPWNYGREFTTLHEIGHLVWEYKMSPKLKKEWTKIASKTKNKQNQCAEELFCHAYACHYAKHKIAIHDHEEWHNFIKNKVPK